MTSLKEYVAAHYGDSNYVNATEKYFEFFEDAHDIIWLGSADRHRWYTRQDVVWKVNIEGVDRYFKYHIYDAHGDGDREDCGYEIPDLDDIPEVFPKEVTTTIYVTKDKL